MSVVIETTLGDITVDLFVHSRPRACLNFLKLCKIKYFNYNLFHTISRGFIAQTGDPTGSRKGGESIFGVLGGPLKRYFEGEKAPRIKHTVMGLVSFVGTEDHMIGSQFFITLGNDLMYLDEQHCVFGEVMEGLDVLEMLNETICDQDNRPYKDVRITHTIILDDPFPDPESLPMRSRSPSPSAERLQGGRLAPDEEVDEGQGKSAHEVNEIIAAKEAKARATILEMIGDIPDADMAPPENVLFVCKLNPVTTDDDLEIIFSRFGKINSCEVIRDKKTGESLQYAFVEFDERKACEDAYFKMDNVLIDDRRIHVDFSQSVAKVRWHGKGRGVTTYDDKGKRSTDRRNEIGNGKYQKVFNEETKRKRSRSPYKRENKNSDNSADRRRYNKVENRRNREDDYFNKRDPRENSYERRNRHQQRNYAKVDYRLRNDREKRRFEDRKEHGRCNRPQERHKRDEHDREQKKYDRKDKRTYSRTDSKDLDEKRRRRKKSSSDGSAEEDTSSSGSDSSSEERKPREKRKKSSGKHKEKKQKKLKKKKKKRRGSSSDES